MSSKGSAPGNYTGGAGTGTSPFGGGSASGQALASIYSRQAPTATQFNTMFNRPAMTSSKPQGSYYDLFQQLFRPTFQPVPGIPLPGQPVPTQNPGPGAGPGNGSGGSFNDPARPSWGGWAWGNVPVDSVIRAHFNWFEVGYPDAVSSADYARMRSAGITPFAYINLGEQVPDMAGQTGYNGPILRQNGDWGTQLVDVTNPTWKNWLIRRANDAYSRGARGIKWDVATPDVPPGKSRQQVNDAIADVMRQIRQQHPDLRFVFNQGFDFAKAYPQYVNGMETEGLFSASSYPQAYLQPWKDPWYWGPQYNDAKQLAQRGIPVFVAEYTDPWSQRAKDLYNAINGQGFIPYITSENWQARGYGLNINPGW